MTDENDADGPELQQESFQSVPVCWPALAKVERKDRLKALTKWIDWLTRRYALDHRTVPPCWALHGALIEELSALYTGWASAYAVASSADRPLRWHADFAMARKRLGEWVARSGCRVGEHRSDPSDLEPTRTLPCRA